MNLADFDGDDQVDLLYRDENGHFACSLESSQSELLSNRLVSGFEKASSWHIAIMANLDTDRKADLLLLHPTGMWEYVPMEGGKPREEDRSVVSDLADETWRIVLALDIDDDGRDEPFWRNDEGPCTIRYIDGAVVRKTVQDPAGLPIGTEWNLVGSGDLYSDGETDLVIRHRDGIWQRVWLSQVDEVTFSATTLRFELDSVWRKESIADFEGEGKADSLLRHTKGHWKIRSLSRNDDTQIVAWDVKTLPPSREWRSEGFGDQNGDGRDDLFRVTLNTLYLPIGCSLGTLDDYMCSPLTEVRMHAG